MLIRLFVVCFFLYIIFVVETSITKPLKDLLRLIFPAIWARPPWSSTAARPDLPRHSRQQYSYQHSITFKPPLLWYSSYRAQFHKPFLPLPNLSSFVQRDHPSLFLLAVIDATPTLIHIHFVTNRLMSHPPKRSPHLGYARSPAPFSRQIVLGYGKYDEHASRRK